MVEEWHFNKGCDENGGICCAVLGTGLRHVRLRAMATHKDNSHFTVCVSHCVCSSEQTVKADTGMVTARQKKTLSKLRRETKFKSSSN